MAKRPLPITLIGWLMIAAGVVGILYHAGELRTPPANGSALFVLLVLALRLLAIVAGAFLLRGCNWARWLTVAWLALHVVISARNSWAEFGTHALLLVVFVFFLFRSCARQYFAAGNA